MPKHTAIYIRVSTHGQNEAGQRRDLEHWISNHGIENVSWYVDKETGDNLNRPAFERLQKDVFAGDVSTVVVWKLDRLSRKLRDGINVICDWCDRGIRVVAITQDIDFSGTVGKIIASVLLGIGEMEQQHRRERQAAGIAAAKAKGKTWGGSKPGTRTRATPTKIKLIHQMKEQGTPITEIAKALGLSRPTIYDVLRKS